MRRSSFQKRASKYTSKKFYEIDSLRFSVITLRAFYNGVWASQPYKLVPCRNLNPSTNNLGWKGRFTTNILIGKAETDNKRIEPWTCAIKLITTVKKHPSLSQEGILKGKVSLYHWPPVYWFGLVCFANKNKNCQLSYSWYHTSETVILPPLVFPV